MNDEQRVMRYQIEQLQRRVQQLETTSNFVSQDGTFTVFDDTGKPVIVLGKLAAGIYGMSVKNPAGNELLRLGEQSDGKYNLSVFDTSGVRQSRVGELSAGYGIEDIDASGNTVTMEQLAFGPTTASVATVQTTTSTSYTDLATAGPAVTVTIGNSGRAIVFIGAAILSDAASPSVCNMSYAVSGATTIAAADSRAITVDTSSGPGGTGVAASPSGFFLVSGLTPGTNTFTLKYRTSSGDTATFANRNILVQPF